MNGITGRFTAGGASHGVMALMAAALALVAVPAVAAEKRPVAAAEKALAAVWAQAPLEFRKALFVTEATAFGIYTARADAEFAPGEPIRVYAEPVGYGYLEHEDGTYGFGFDIDLLVKTDDGTVVGGQDGFAHLTLESHSRNREFMLALTLELGAAPPGEYRLEYTAHDIASDDTAVIALPFSIAE